MKGNGKMTVLMLAVVLTVSVFATGSLAFANEPNADDDVIKVFLNGQMLTFEAEPLLTSGRVLVPLRTIFEAMGAEVEWDASTRTAIATKDDTVVKITIDDDKPTINGEVFELNPPQPAILTPEGHTLAPLRFAAEAFGGSAAWDGATRTADITLEEKETLVGSEGTSIEELLEQVEGIAEPVPLREMLDGLAKEGVKSEVENLEDGVSVSLIKDSVSATISWPRDVDADIIVATVKFGEAETELDIVILEGRSFVNENDTLSALKEVGFLK